MDSKNYTIKISALILIGIAAGLIIVAVDNFAFQGEVSPIMIVLMLVIVTSTSGFVLGRRGWIVSSIMWVCVPLAHFIKHFFGLPDTLHPNTYISIMLLAAFTLIVSVVGFGIGVLLKRFIKSIDNK